MTLPGRKIDAATLDQAATLGSIHYGNETVIVEKSGKPFAVVISPEQYERRSLIPLDR